MTKISLALIAAVMVFSTWLLVSPMQVQAAACPVPTTDFGSGTMNISVPATGAYRVWSRVMAPNTTNNSYSLEVDGTNCYVIGDSQLAANTWTWVDYQGGTPTSKLNLSLSAGAHSFKLVGREADVAIDRVMVVSDTSCVPVDMGNNCTATADQTPPAVAFTAPATGATVSGSVDVNATATDASGVAKVEFYVDSVLKATTTTAPYTYNWDTISLSNGSHSLSARAYDTVGNTSAANATVTVKNGDTQAPSTPANLTATTSTPTAVDLKWSASTDNTGVTGYYIQRNNVTIAQLGSATAYKDAAALAGTNYTYRIIAFDAAGNVSQPSATASVTTPQPPVTDTQAPSVPGGVSASAVSPSQINLKWAASTDNIGVAKYNVYRSTNGSQASKVATVTTTSYGDTGLSAGTQYAYYVTAEDTAGNVSAASTTAGATTPQTTSTKRGRINGKVTTTSGVRFSGAHVAIWVNGSKQLYHTQLNGNYTISRLPAGIYKVEYSSHDNDYQPQTYDITVVAEQTTTKNVSLKHN